MTSCWCNPSRQKNNRASLGKPSKNNRDNWFPRILFMSLEDKRTNLFRRILFMSLETTELIYSAAFYSWVWKTKELIYSSSFYSWVWKTKEIIYSTYFIYELWRHPKDNVCMRRTCAAKIRVIRSLLYYWSDSFRDLFYAVLLSWNSYVY